VIIGIVALTKEGHSMGCGGTYWMEGPKLNHYSTEKNPFSQPYFLGVQEGQEHCLLYPLPVKNQR